MRTSLALASLAVALIAIAPQPSFADRPEELQAARLNALAGGPTNERDRELLQRYGALSGTPGYDRSGLRRRHHDRHHHYTKRHRHHD